MMDISINNIFAYLPRYATPFGHAIHHKGERSLLYVPV